MQAHTTKEHSAADVRTGGAAVQTPQRPTATNRITHPSTPLATWLDALCKTSEAQRAHLRESLAAAGVRA